MAPVDDRYVRQRVLPEIGDEGQERLIEASALVVGCGALGSVEAELMARAGVGRIRIADRDVVEENNLQRQVLFDEKDVRDGLPKAEAAARKLRAINSTITIEPMVTDVTPRNVERIIDGMSVVLDGTDNFETRYLVNDACVKHATPWVYGGVLGTSGTTMAVVPREGPCIRCLFPAPPPHGSMPTCETAGVLAAASAVVGALEVAAAIKLITLQRIDEHRLVQVDPWSGAHLSVRVERRASCPCCGQGTYEYLDAMETGWITALCGRNSIQIEPAHASELSLEDVAARLEAVGTVQNNGLLLRVQIGEHRLLVFPDGRAIIQGTTDEAVARSLYSKYLGN
jgi:adenylyltransferase/sulfurtransferase